MKFGIALVNYTKKSIVGQKAPWCLKINDKWYIPVSKSLDRLLTYKYEVSYDNGSLYVHWGVCEGFKPIGKEIPQNWRIFYMPWMIEQVAKEYYTVNGMWKEDIIEEENWENLTEKERYWFKENRLKTWQFGLRYCLPSWKEHLPEDVLNQKAVATCSMERWIGSWRILKKLGIWKLFPKRVIQDLNIEFDREIGSDKGSWKGGVVGFSRKMKNGESVQDAFCRIIGEADF